MEHYDWNDAYFAWGWLLWAGIVFLLISTFGNWRYTYNAHQKYRLQPQKGARDILNERYARGEIPRDELGQMKTEIARK